MDSNNNNIVYRDNENTSDFDLLENNEPHNVSAKTKRKTLEEPIK
ncbi:16539_t:CDS:1, partial [Dentiscutata heterogama]